MGPRLLQPGQTVRTEASGSPCRVEEFLGGGGQGEVYRAELLGRPCALKWYYAMQATREHHEAIAALVRRGPPSDRFLWPMEIASAAGVPGFGYVMPLRPARFRGIADLVQRQVEPTYRALTTAGFQLAACYLALHARGLCYRDISFGNAFFDPDTGEVLICDNDNVAINGDVQGGVLGTPRFMAPEVVRGEVMPSIDTDLYSLAVLLFYLLTLSHPLEGRRETVADTIDLPSMVRIYGRDPLFIFDPENDSNRPDTVHHAAALTMWPLYPQFLRDLFTRAFTTGLRDPQHGRIRENQWRSAMVRLRDAIVYCPSCGKERFYDDTASASGSPAARCWSCSSELRLPPRLQLGNHRVMLNHDTAIFPHHIDSQRPYDFSEAVARVVPHPTKPEVWGLKNYSNLPWTAAGAEGGQISVPAGRSVTLREGVRIGFGAVDGTVVAT
jgi:eukaryotic-like serine/threonine-protein kinase